MSSYIHLHGAKRRMRYSPGKIVTHGCKLYIEAWSPYTYDLIFVVRKDSKIECFVGHNFGLHCFYYLFH